jgi:hypothetical protein
MVRMEAGVPLPSQESKFEPGAAPTYLSLAILDVYEGVGGSVARQWRTLLTIAESPLLR